MKISDEEVEDVAVAALKLTNAILRALRILDEATEETELTFIRSDILQAKLVLREAIDYKAPQMEVA